MPLLPDGQKKRCDERDTDGIAHPPVQQIVEIIGIADAAQYRAGNDGGEQAASAASQKQQAQVTGDIAQQMRWLRALSQQPDGKQRADEAGKH